MEIVSVHLFDELPKPVINKSIQLVLAHHHLETFTTGTQFNYTSCTTAAENR